MLTSHKKRMLFVVVAVLAMAAPLLSADQPAGGSLFAGWQNAPAAARPATYYLLLNGYVNRDHIASEIRQLHSAGVRGLCVFDMGARGPKETLPPDGPEFMSDAWLDNFGLILRTAGELNMDVQLAVSSSWDMGASWVKPQDASKALYHASVSIAGPGRFDQLLPVPTIPAKAPRDDQGRPVFLKDIAVLAVPEGKRQEGHEFVFELPGRSEPVIDHVVLYNAESDDPKTHGPMQLFAKEFSVAVSRTDAREASFREIVRGSLEPHMQAQRFVFAAAAARFVRLRIYSGHNARSDRVTLGEFEVYSTEGRNVAGSHEADRLGAAANLVRFSSQWDRGGWTADNIHDGVRNGAAGSWSSAGPPPLVVADAAAVVDLTDRLDGEGRLQWDVPAGNWTIVRYVCANTGELLKVPSPVSNGLATDHFSGQVTAEYIDYLVKRLRARFGDLRQTALKQLYLPSYEVRGAVWTDDFIEQFRAYRGYDCTRYLPALHGTVIESTEVTDRFLYDFQKTLGDLLVDAYYRTASETARRAGLGIEAESGGPGPPVHHVPVDALKALGAIDEVRGEFWPWRDWTGPLWVVKETACAAHIYGRKRVHMESFTGFRHWQDGPFELKPAADRAFCEGMNHVVWHTSSHQPPEAGKPGWVYGAGTHLTPNLAWWPMAPAFIDYLSRCSFMLQQGLFVADVCYYYGDKGSNFVPPKHVDPSLGYGYDYDVANPEVILSRMTVRDGRIVLPDGMRYELLVLPDLADIDLAVLTKVAELVKAGATVVGRKPGRSNGLHDYRNRDQQVAALADVLWGKCDGQRVKENVYGKGRIVWGETLRDVLSSRGVGPDFSFTAQNSDADLDYIHRRTDSEDIYFIRNAKGRPEQVDACFRVFGKTPQLWHAETGKITVPSDYEQTPAGIRVRLELDPAGSLFVVFGKPADLPPAAASDIRFDEAAATELTGSWKVSFPSGWGAPESVMLPKLISWTEHDNTGVRHFSGAARYEKTFDISADRLGDGGKLCLDLGDLWAVGEVSLNGQSLGVLWTPPYRVDITDAARSGRNVLEVRIANTWANRLVGDALSPVGERFCRTNIVGSGTVRKAWKDIELRRSGLFGPVRIIPGAEIKQSLMQR
ncbi:MAG: hypothetical protein IH624_08810 [Phycisphaerae bacterium]|nr:hypothetical protein [Phycisphaerae bacterium]